MFALHIGLQVWWKNHIMNQLLETHHLSTLPKRPEAPRSETISITGYNNEAIPDA